MSQDSLPRPVGRRRAGAGLVQGGRRSCPRLVALVFATWRRGGKGPIPAVFEGADDPPFCRIRARTGRHVVDVDAPGGPPPIVAPLPVYGLALLPADQVPLDPVVNPPRLKRFLNLARLFVQVGCQPRPLTVEFVPLDPTA